MLNKSKQIYADLIQFIKIIKPLLKDAVFLSTNGHYKINNINKRKKKSKRITASTLKTGRIMLYKGLPWWLSGKESACQCGSMDSISGPQRSAEEGNGKSLQILAWEIP